MEARFAEDVLSNLLQMGTVAEYQNDFEMLIKRVTGISEFLLKSFYNFGLKLTLQIELLRARPTTLVEAFSLAHNVEITSGNDARDQACEVEMKVLVDGKQDDAKAVKVVGVVVEQNNDKPNVLEGNGVIGVGVNEINKWVDKEVQYSVSTLHVLIQLLKRLNDKHIKKKKMKAEIQRRI
ncbi:hypothetical protein Tco_0058937 [Tanacetum coccineum]